MSATVSFDVCVQLPLTSERAWARLTDWGTHGDWIPMTRVDVDAADPASFVAWSGIGKLALEDRMHLEDERFDGTSGWCRVAKLGPVLIGSAELSVTPGLAPDSAVVQWREIVTMRHLPGFLAPVAAFIGKRLFTSALHRMAKRG